MHLAPSASRTTPGQSRPMPQFSLCRLASSGNKDRTPEWVMPERLAYQRNKAVGTTAKIHRLGCHQNPHSCRDRDHVAAFTARRTSRSQPRSTPGSARTAAPAISITIEPTGCPTVRAAPGPPTAVTTGTNIGEPAAGRTKRPARAALRHANRCCGVMSCRRATSDATAPGSYDSATTWPFTSSLHRRRRPIPVRISMRPRRPEASTIWSTIYANRSQKDRLHLPDQIKRYKMGTGHRLQSIRGTVLLELAPTLGLVPNLAV